MKKILLLLVLLVSLLSVVALVPATSPTAYAGNKVVVVITANPNPGNATCPWGFTINPVTLYEIELDWNAGNGSVASMVRAAYGRWPGNATDGFEVYNGNETEITHWINTEFIGVDVYYRVYDEYGNGTYSTCYSAGSITGGESMEAIANQISNLAVMIPILGVTVCLIGFGLYRRIRWLLAFSGAALLISGILMIVVGFGGTVSGGTEIALQSFGGLLVFVAMGMLLWIAISDEWTGEEGGRERVTVVRGGGGAGAAAIGVGGAGGAGGAGGGEGGKTETVTYERKRRKGEVEEEESAHDSYAKKREEVLKAGSERRKGRRADRWP